jgi:CubicO group peptidase (beta-lactamase class C family)
MQLAEKGKLSPQDPVTNWLSDFEVPEGANADSITIHHLLTHTSGLPTLPSRYYAQYRDIMNDPNRDRIQLPYDVSEFHPIDTFDDLIELLCELDFELLAAPGEMMSYSNEGYALLGAIIERASGMLYAEYVHSNLLEPVEMEYTAFAPDTVAEFPEVTQLYSSVEEGGDEKEVFATPGWWEKNAMYSCGHLKSNVRDLLHYIDTYRKQGQVNGDRLAQPDTIEQMLHPHAPIVASSGSHYGYGFVVEPDFHGTRRIKHGGGDKGVSAHLSLLPEKGIAVAVLTNLSGVPAEKLAVGALNAALGLAVNTPAVQYTKQQLPLEVLQSFEGTYESGEGATVRFFLEEDQLWVEYQGKSLPASPVAEDLVLAEPDRDTQQTFRFLKGEEDRAWAVATGVRVLTRTAESGGE